MVPDILKRLLRQAGKRLTRWACLGERIVITAASMVKSASCPACGRRSRQRHGRYWRRLAECPCFSHPVSLEVEVRRFRCTNDACPRQTFAEPLVPLAASRQRCTTQLARARRAIGLALGGRAGARLAVHLGMNASGDTLLREVRRTAPAPAAEPLRVIGIDDWAIARGHRYGTLVVDLERHRPIEMLADREAETVAAWLRGRPDLRVIARDRAGAYADAARRAAPAAEQVADRWHLVRNLREALERLLSRHGTKLREAAEFPPPPSAPKPAADPQTDAAPPDGAAPHRTPSARRRVAANRARRLARYEEVIRRRAAGEPISAIARVLGLDRRTVRKFARAPVFPERALRARAASPLDAVRPYLATRAAAGCWNAMQIWRELVADGCKGSYRSVQRAFAVLRGSSQTRSPVESATALKSPDAKTGVPSPRRACGWLLHWPARRSDATANGARDRFVTRLRELEPVIQAAQALALRFMAILHDRDADGFERWLVKARHCAVVELRRFAASLETDLAAVRAAVTSPWSSGQVEGQINRLKYLKRQMFGRAKLDLLRIRVLSRI